MAKVLFYDIETAPNLAYVWGHYDQNVVKQHREWYMMCFGFRWEGTQTTKVVALPDFDLYDEDPENDREVVRVLWDLIDEADVVVAHNGDKFDMKKANARFIVHEMGPPAPVQQIDTLKASKRYFKFNSNKLDDLGTHLSLGNKAPTGGFALWEGCMNGDEKSWRTMKKYAKQDVDLLADLYYKMRPWMTNHPNRALLDGRPDSCPTCGHESFMRRGYQRTKVAEYANFQCKGCGAYCRERVRSDTASPNLVP